ncbi:MAG: D-alanyl-D-alanine carboxypeptidase family protein [Thermoanaerobaculia bacterium]
MRRPLFLLAILATLALGVQAQEEGDYRSAILIEPTTGTVLFEKAADDPAPIASMTKMMTALVVLEQVAAGKIDWETPISTSANASRMGGSQVYLRHREVFPLREMMAAMFVHSANDAAMAIAEHVGGSEEQFVAMMNARARELGMKNTRFVTPHGLPAEAGGADDMSTPRDLSRLAVELMKHPTIRELAKVEQMPFRQGKFTLWNPNDLISRYGPATGLKTGTHDRAGSCLTATASKNGMDLVAVLMGANQRRQLFQTTESMLEEAFSSWEIVEPVRRGSPVDQPLPVAGGRVPAVAGVAAADARVVLRTDESDSIQTRLQPLNPPAPVQKGERVGWLIVSKAGQPIGRVSVVAMDDVPNASILQRFWDHVWPW